MPLSSNWSQQFILLLSTVLITFGGLAWNYQIPRNHQICTGEPFSPWTEYYLHYLLGAAMGTNLLQFFRVLLASVTDNKLRHPNAIAMGMILSTIQFICLSGQYLEGTPSAHSQQIVSSPTCIDSLSIRTTPWMWTEWICSVPWMFFLVAMMDVKAVAAGPRDGIVQALAMASVLLLAAGSYTQSQAIGCTCMGVGYACMLAALGIQQVSCRREHSQSLAALTVDQAECMEAHDAHSVLSAQLTCNSFLCIAFSCFPCLYALRWMGLLDDDVLMLLCLSGSFLTKSLFLQLVSDCHIDILDPNKLLLVEEKKKAEESRLMFLRYVFHEVRVPLNSVALGLQLLDSEHTSEQDRETITLMREATAFMAETLNDVLSLQKIEEGMLELEYKPFQPSNLVKAVMGNFRAQYESKHITVTSTLSPLVPQTILGDQFRLEHVLGNLLSNAIKFSDPHSLVEIVVSNTSIAPSHSVTFTVIDHGPGMTADEQKMLFKPFMQIRPGELQKGRGSGLGLSICKTIVSLHHGVIGCRSKQRTPNAPGGSEFFFTIEYQDDAATGACGASDAGTGTRTAPSTPSSKKSRACSITEDDILPDSSSARVIRGQKDELGEVSGKLIALASLDITPTSSFVLDTSSTSTACTPMAVVKHRILVCDDVLSNRKMLDMILRKKGFVCDQCADGAEAVSMVGQKGVDFYDMVFMDSVMPIMCGPEAAHRIRSMGYSKLLIGVTGNAMDLDVLDFETNGADLILTKPMRMDALQKLLDYCERFGCKSHHMFDIPQDEQVKTWVYSL